MQLFQENKHKIKYKRILEMQEILLYHTIINFSWLKDCIEENGS